MLTLIILHNYITASGLSVWVYMETKLPHKFDVYLQCKDYSMLAYFTHSAYCLLANHFVNNRTNNASPSKKNHVNNKCLQAMKYRSDYFSIIMLPVIVLLATDYGCSYLQGTRNNKTPVHFVV